MKMILANILLSSALVGFVGCSKDDDDKKPAATSGLSTQFTATCATSSCHGPTGAGGTAGSNLLGITLSEEEFKNIVRNGTSGMSAIDVATYSEESLTADYAYLKSAK